MHISHWFIARQELSPAKNKGLAIASFLLPLLIWAIVSYVPFVWHPMMKIVDSGDVEYFQVDMLVDKTTFQQELVNMQSASKNLPVGAPANPVYLPAPHVHFEAF
jgi:NitT/TauT family transport system permease protein